MNSPKHPDPAVIRWFVFDRLLQDAEKKNYQRIESLYVSAGLKNADLVPLLNEKRALDLRLPETIYNDMCFVLAERIAEDEELGSLFQKLYRDDFSRLSRSLEKSAETADLWDSFRHGKFYEERDMEEFRFPDGEPVFQSRAFANYVRARKKALAEFLGVNDGSLVNYYHDNLRPRFVISKNGDEIIQTSRGNIYFGTVFSVVSEHLNTRCGSADWIREILYAKNSYLEERGIRRKGWDYYPDLDRIMDNYFRGKVGEYYWRAPAETGFIRPMLRDECVPGSPIEDHISICWLYYLDVIYEMLRRMQAKYYRDFTWESVSGRSVQERYAAVLDSYKEMCAQQESLIRSTESKIRELEADSDAGLAKAERRSRAEADALRKELLRKDEEIRQLKEQLSWQEQLTDEAAKEPEEPENTGYERSAILSKRYLFVGFQEAVSELRKEFPGSVFMTTESAQISGLRVDAVVLLTRYMKHHMFYKVRSEGSLKGVPLIYCNGAGTDAVCEAIRRSGAALL